MGVFCWDEGIVDGWCGRRVGGVNDSYGIDGEVWSEALDGTG